MSAANKHTARAPEALRGAMLSKLHCAKRDLRLGDEEYRDLLRQKTGKDSARDLNDAELGIVLDEMRKRGFRSPATSEPNQRPGQPQERLAIALWKDLGALNVLDDPSEGGLRRFARHLVGVEAIEWADANQMNRVIPEGMANQGTAHTSNPMNHNVRAEVLRLIEEEKIALLAEVGNELRRTAGTKLVATVARIVIGIRDASDEEERQEMSDHAMLYLDDIKWLIEIMGRDQTIRSALKPGDRVVVVKSGGKTVNNG